VAAIEVYDLAKKSHFLHAMRDEGANFGDDFGNGAAAFRSARARHDTKGAMHVAALHDGNERRGLPWSQRLFANRRLRAGFFLDVHDGITWIVHAAVAGVTDPGYSIFVQNQIIYIVSDAMKFLRADDKIEMRNFLQQLRATACRHAAKKSEDSFRAVLAMRPSIPILPSAFCSAMSRTLQVLSRTNIGLDLGIDALIARAMSEYATLLGNRVRSSGSRRS
jgi:hypothetical protein